MWVNFALILLINTKGYEETKLASIFESLYRYGTLMLHLISYITKNFW